ncbi:MAG: DUF2924 domain-containing protein [Planctomycetes bacterium]|nr:DUF2924 domain-containing protein [Planctomycetota bacterium]NOG53325.1 DUF2924 domain-containing protein [Planctomycetota bacterium]
MNVKKEIAALTRMTVTELRKKHIEVFGERTRSGHKAYLVKRIAWRLQANAEGNLTTRARRRAEELANDADLRTHAPRCKPDAEDHGDTMTAAVHFGHDTRVPMPGATLSSKSKGRDVFVHLRRRGFEYAGKAYCLLSVVASAVTSGHWDRTTMEGIPSVKWQGLLGGGFWQRA